MDNKVISVIIPIYNTEKYLEECIESVIKQTYKHLEIILVDDGSTDNSGILADQYAVKDKRICVIHKENQGVSSARNAGINIAQGEWIAFVDSDDTIAENYFETLVNNILEYRADISICISKIVDEDGSVLLGNELESTSIEVMNSEEAIIHLLKADIFGCGITKLYRASLWREYRVREDIHINEDLLTNYFCFLKATKVVYINYRLYNYRQRRESVSRSGYNKRQLDIVKVNEIILNDSADNKTISIHSEKRLVRAIISVYRGAIIAKDKETQKKLENKIRKLIFNIFKNKQLSLLQVMESLMIIVCPLMYKIIVRGKAKMKNI